jgi:hypothetical protein
LPGAGVIAESGELRESANFRSVVEELGEQNRDDAASLFLGENADWQQKYAPGKLKRKRLDMFADTFIPQEE